MFLLISGAEGESEILGNILSEWFFSARIVYTTGEERESTEVCMLSERSGMVRADCRKIFGSAPGSCDAEAFM